MTYDYQTGQPYGSGTGGTDGSRTDAAKEAARDTASTAKEQAAGVAHSAKESGQHLAHEAKSQAKEVGREAGQQARQLVDSGRRQLTDEASSQQQKLAGGLRTFGEELQTMAGASEQPGLATDVARQISDRVDTLAEWLEQREPGDLLQEVKTFARNRPGTFLAIAAGAGLLAGRLTRGVKDASSDGPTGEVAVRSDYATPTGYGTEGYAAEAAGLAGTTGAAPARTSAFGAAAAPTTSTYGTGAVYGESGTYGTAHGEDALGTAGGDPTAGVEGGTGTAVYPDGAGTTDPYGTGTTSADDTATQVYGQGSYGAYGAGTQDPPSGEGQYTSGTVGYGVGEGETPERESSNPWTPVSGEEEQR
ncbi:hypothetical protein Q9R32_09680 [Actinotalea sp. AC32]|nr:hypothetical protein [Actinotalea sp. AC32]